VRFAYVLWIDASKSAEEHALEDMNPMTLPAAGFVIRETPDDITLSLEPIMAETKCRMWLTIPKRNILKIHRTTAERAFHLKGKP
jgi:hypothetical protein